MNERNQKLANIWANRRAEDPKLGITYTFSEKALDVFAEEVRAEHTQSVIRNRMKSKLNELRLDAGIARIENQQWLCVLDKETGMMVDPLIGLEKFAELIIRECASIASNPATGCYTSFGNDIKKHFGVEE